jgi:hypothetical protein
MTSSTTLLLAATVVMSAGSAAYAHDFDQRSDWREVQRDRARLYADLARLRDERAELATPARREHWALRHGKLWQAWNAAQEERSEAYDVRALRQRVDRDRNKYDRERADLRHDLRRW